MRNVFAAVSIAVLAFVSGCTSDSAIVSTWEPPAGREPPPESVARIWNETLLDAIRRDTPRPGVHARNLFHLSAAMYDAWALYDGKAKGYLVPLKVLVPDDIRPYARAETISFAAYRILKARFATSPGAAVSEQQFDDTMEMLGFDGTYTGTAGLSPADLGNLIAQTVLAYGLGDNSNETGNYADSSYAAANPSLITELSGTSLMSNPNRWQPLAFDYAVSQNGIPIGALVQKFVGSQWGRVTPFALRKKPSDPPYLYYDPGPPFRLDPVHAETTEEYRNEAVKLIRMSSQLTPNLEEYIDLSPGGYGNNPLGTDDGEGYVLNPVTGQPYTPQMVKIGDFGRVLAEHWADGPHSETPPGHWNVIANEVGDTPGLVRRIGGRGNEVDRLEWDIKLYFALNGAVHDAAIACWGIKRHYDSARPISMIRYMAEKGQSTDPELPSYNAEGLPLIPDLIELITEETTADGQKHEHLAGHEGEIAIRSWLGVPEDPLTEIGDVGWILAIDWFPYQLPTFITPAFPGYTSGHSTFSRAAAEVLTGFTDSPWFPGGLGEFHVEAGTGLKFEYGPSDDIALQWASYYDAADQAGQSRRWGGIHPSMDDYPSRIIGSEIGKAAWALAKRYFKGEQPARQAHLPPLSGPPPATDVPSIPKEPVEKPPYTVPDPGECSLVAEGTYRTSPEEPGCPEINTTCTGSGGVVIQKITGAVSPTHGAYIHVDTNLLPGAIEVRLNDELLTEIYKDPEDSSRGAIYALPRPEDTALPLCPVKVAVRPVDATEDDDCEAVEIVRPYFEDVADVMGLSFFHKEETETQSYASGVAFGDVDNDGDLDLYIPNFDEPGKFFLNNGDTNADAIPDFTDVTEAVGLAGGEDEDEIIIDRGASASFADYDNDGDRDLFIGRQGDSRLFQNQLVETETATFLDVTEDAGLLDIPSRVTGQAWGDYDGDGDLDLYLSTHVNLNEPPGSWHGHLFRNDNGLFMDITSSALAEQIPDTHPTVLFSFAATWIDVDGDGDLDLMVTSDDINPEAEDIGNVRPNVLWRNDGPGESEGDWVFTDVSASSGWAIYPDAKGQGMNVMGMSAGDLNRDGKPDFALSNIGPNYLLLNSTADGNIGFSDISDSAGIRRTHPDWEPETPGASGALAWFDMSATWASILFDTDNDGDLDLFYAGGPAFHLFGMRVIPNALFVNNGSNVFTDRTPESGTLDTASSLSTALVDIDQDGFQDLAVANVGGKFRFYLNVVPQNGNANRWLQVDLMGTVSNRDAYGSVVRVTTENTGTQTCWVVSTNGQGSGSENTCAFGLGSDDEITDLEIQWPDGTVSYPDIPDVDTRILCKEPAPD